MMPHSSITYDWLVTTAVLRKQIADKGRDQRLAERRIKRRDKKRRREMPLFGDATLDQIEPLETVDEITALYKAQFVGVLTRELRNQYTMLRHWARYRRACETVMTMDEIRAEERRCQRLYREPGIGRKTAARRANHWHGVCRKLGLEERP